MKMVGHVKCLTKEPQNIYVTLKVPVTTTADDTYFFLYFNLSKEVRLAVSCESSA